ncbi:hypothetical protein [Fulvivirga sedimenti]|uniref:Uncharacterized protein n=1 Tax=Fulvivirga sedimenti TaxID=2879465 RepID=A0A9X1L2H5_9BACT|nr:hypothetical protein [Fulvivirga sedimenti]MCA6078196.1 hypothetical protein [Fulvivirga sedimenti]
MNTKVAPSPRKIRLRRALILGNFYDRQVQIEQAQEDGEETIVDAVVGIRPEGIITKSGRNIALHSIKSIYQL